MADKTHEPSKDIAIYYQVAFNRDPQEMETPESSQVLVAYTPWGSREYCVLHLDNDQIRLNRREAELISQVLLAASKHLSENTLAEALDRRFNDLRENPNTCI